MAETKAVKKTVKKEVNTEKVVKITRQEILDSPNVMKTINNKLKEAGIPVIEGILLGRVNSGTLTSEEDLEKGIYIYRWKP